MFDSTRRFVARATSLMPLAVPLVLLVLAVGCGPSDPLEKVRVLQDQKKDFQGSLEPLRKLIETRPNDPEVHYRYGNALIAAGSLGLAVLPLEKAIESPDWLEKAGLVLTTALVLSPVLSKAPGSMVSPILRARNGALPYWAFSVPVSSCT